MQYLYSCDTLGCMNSQQTFRAGLYSIGLEVGRTVLVLLSEPVAVDVDPSRTLEACEERRCFRLCAAVSIAHIHHIYKTISKIFKCARKTDEGIHLMRRVRRDV